MTKIWSGVALGLAFGLVAATPALADPYGGEGDRDGYRHDDGGEGDGWSPRGSYRSSCGDIHVDGSELEARCRDRDGDWRRTSLDNFRDCRGDIFNDNGRLRCRHDDDDDAYGGGGGYDEHPRRGYGRITLYVDSNFRGGRRTFDRDIPDLHEYSFADRASSAYVQGGVWQVCTRPYYRGRCVTIDENVYNFQNIGINDRTESLRRVR